MRFYFEVPIIFFILCTDCTDCTDYFLQPTVRYLMYLFSVSTKHAKSLFIPCLGILPLCIFPDLCSSTRRYLIKLSTDKTNLASGILYNIGHRTNSNST